MKSCLYLWEPLCKRFIEELTIIKGYFLERIYPVFANIEDEVEKYQKDIWEDFMSTPCPCEEMDIDPSDFAVDCIEAGIEKYQILSVMKYRNLAMWIMCLCQVWEQQLIKFILDEARHCGLKYNDKDVSKGFEFTKKAFELYGIKFESLSCWPGIKELRALVNTLKHSEGDSANKLRKLRPYYFQWEGTDKLEVYGSTLLDDTLNISTNDFINYYNVLVSFWEILPETMCKV